MATLNINGKRVKVTDDFLSLSPEQQNATVDEIASQLNAQAPAPSRISSRADADAAWAAGRSNPALANVPEFKPVGKDGQPLDGYDPKTGEMSPTLGTLGTAAASMPEGVPIAGPFLDKAARAASAGLGSLISGDPYGKVRSEMDAMIAKGQEQHPVARIGGNIAGALAVLGPIGGTEAGGTALGLRGTLGQRVLNSSISTAGLNGADTLARGGSLGDAAESSIWGAGLGAAFPLAGAGLSRSIGAGADYLGSLFRAARKPASEAERRLGMAMKRDAGTSMTAADEAVARQNNIPLTNVDRGGETVRALARSAANQSPETRAAIENVAQDRFAGQSNRAADFVRRLTGGNADDLALQEQLRAAARRANNPAYKRAEMAPAALDMSSPELLNLLRAPAVREAAAEAEKRGANRAVASGSQPIRNPFVFGENGSISMKGGVRPTLRFWDQVKRNLDDKISVADRQGDRTYSGDLKALKNKLVEHLDTAVPEYKVARQGAAGFFGAEDALDAGRKFATQKSAIPEARRAIQQFNGAEKKAFETGFASEIIDRIKASPDRTNVINSVFKSQAAREQMQLVFGPVKAKELEAYVRVENLVDRLRGAMGNSTTARQLVELGIGATGGYMATGDIKGALLGAAMVRGPRYVKGKIEENVMREIGNILTADNPAAMNRIVKNAALSPAYMNALEKISNSLQLTGQASTLRITH